MKRIIPLLALFALAVSAVEAKPKQLKAWSEGTLDIHHISTGRGSAIFFILPDGTRLLADAGDLGDPARWTHKEIMPAMPNATKRPAEWIARYISNSSPLVRHSFITCISASRISTRSPLRGNLEPTEPCVFATPSAFIESKPLNHPA